MALPRPSARYVSFASTSITALAAAVGALAAPFLVSLALWGLALVVNAFWLSENWHKKAFLERYGPRIMLGLTVVLAAVLVPKQLAQERRLALPPPEVALEFAHPVRPLLYVVNLSDSVIQDVRWQVVLWNRDVDEPNPLPIPVKTVDWLKPREKSSPQGIFHPERVVPLVKAGNRLFGTAIVNCPTCAQGRTYILHIEWERGGWVYEAKGKDAGKLIVPKNTYEREVYYADLDRLSAAGPRTPISKVATPGPVFEK